MRKIFFAAGAGIALAAATALAPTASADPVDGGGNTTNSASSTGVVYAIPDDTSTPPPGATAPDPPQPSNVQVGNSSNITLGLWKYWPPLNWYKYDLTVAPYAYADYIAGVYLGAKAGGWCLYWRGTTDNIKHTALIPANKVYGLGGWSDNQVIYVNVVARNNATTCPARSV